jgi:16S rRNA (guanine(966)-N(2))-methyltransferase RsmD
MSLRIYGNRLLKTLAGRETRPTPAMVREAVFNIWQGRIAGCCWLDLCAGSGAMGAEALCRGAAYVVGIEQSARACAVIRQNWEQVATGDQTFDVLKGDVKQRLKTLEGQQFDRIYFDPPYASDLYEPVIGAIAHQHLLASDGELAIEHDRDSSLQVPPSLQVCRKKVYGNTALTFCIPVE